MVSEKVKKLAETIIENRGNFYRAAIAAGYSHNSARSPEKIRDTEGYKKFVEPILEKLKQRREWAINAITEEKLQKESSKDLTDVVDKLTKNIQLLGGKPTENIKVDTLSSLSDDELNRIIAESESGESQEGDVSEEIDTVHTEDQPELQGELAPQVDSGSVGEGEIGGDQTSHN